jgi:signal transduction histidine kinase
MNFAFKFFLNVVLLIAISSTQLFSQFKTKTDSTLLKIYAIKNDSVKKERLLTYGEVLIARKDKNAETFINQLEQSYLAKSEMVFLGKLYSRFGFSYITVANYPNAFPLYLKALSIYETVNDPIQKVRVYQDMMWIQLQLEDYQTAKDYLNKALKLATQENLKAKQAEIYNFYGILFDSQNKYEEAIVNYRKALYLNKEFGNVYNEISTLSNLAISLRRTKQLKESLQLLLKVDSIAKKINQLYYLQSSAQNLAELTFEMKDYDLAEKYILDAIKYKGSNEYVLKRGLFQNLENIYKQKNDYKKATQYADSLIELNVNVFEQNKISDLRNLQAKYDLALKDKLNSEQKILSIKQANDIENYKRIVASKNQQQKIGELNLSLEREKASINKTLQEEKLLKNRLLAKKDSVSASNRLIQEQYKSATIKKINYYLLGALICFTFLLLLLWNLFSENKKLNRTITNQKNELIKSNADKDKIFSIIGHDLRSPFNTLQSFTYLLDDEGLNQESLKIYGKQLRGVISKTSILLDNILNWANSQINGYTPVIEERPIKEIIDFEIDNLLEEAGNKHIEVLNNIKQDYTIYTDYNMISIIIRNILSNAIKFTRESGKIIFDAYLENGKVILIIQDNGIGVSDDIKHQFNDSLNQLSFTSSKGTLNEAGTGIGLFLVKNFAQILNIKISVHNLNANEGTIFKLELLHQ